MGSSVPGGALLPLNANAINLAMRPVPRWSSSSSIGSAGPETPPKRPQTASSAKSVSSAKSACRATPFALSRAGVAASRHFEAGPSVGAPTESEAARARPATAPTRGRCAEPHRATGGPPMGPTSRPQLLNELIDHVEREFRVQRLHDVPVGDAGRVAVYREALGRLAETMTTYRPLLAQALRELDAHLQHARDHDERLRQRDAQLALRDYRAAQDLEAFRRETHAQLAALQSERGGLSRTLAERESRVAALSTQLAQAQATLAERDALIAQESFHHNRLLALESETESMRREWDQSMLRVQNMYHDTQTRLIREKRRADALAGDMDQLLVSMQEQYVSKTDVAAQTRQLAALREMCKRQEEQLAEATGLANHQAMQLRAAGSRASRAEQLARAALDKVQAQMGGTPALKAAMLVAISSADSLDHALVRVLDAVAGHCSAAEAARVQAEAQLAAAAAAAAASAPNRRRAASEAPRKRDKSARAGALGSTGSSARPGSSGVRAAPRGDSSGARSRSEAAGPRSEPSGLRTETPGQRETLRPETPVQRPETPGSQTTGLGPQTESQGKTLGLPVAATPPLEAPSAAPPPAAALQRRRASIAVPLGTHLVPEATTAARTGSNSALSTIAAPATPATPAMPSGVSLGRRGSLAATALIIELHPPTSSG